MKEFTPSSRRNSLSGESTQDTKKIQDTQKKHERRNSFSTFEQLPKQQEKSKDEITTQERALNDQIEQCKNTLANIGTLESSLEDKSIQLLKDLAYLHEKIGQTEVERILVEREQNKTIEKLLKDESFDSVDDRFKIVEDLYQKVRRENNSTIPQEQILNIKSYAETKNNDFKAIEEYEINLGEAPQQAALECKKLSDLQNKTELSQTTHSPTNFYNSLTTNSNSEIQAAIKLVQDPLTSQDRDSFYKSIMESIKTGQATDTVGISGEPSYPTAIRYNGPRKLDRLIR